MSSSIERELVKCKQSAEEGYLLAQGKYSDIKKTLNDAENQLSKTDSEQRKVKRIQNTELVKKQKEELRRLTSEVLKIGDALQNLRGRMKDFSIVVYGRTMAGKSTLMEILTHGNGKSIGKGSQRTTLDVRDYYWQGLRIWDVPGISAFSEDAKEARVDESKALEAAKSADLILFLLTSDAPQPDEAEKLAQLKNLGKPVLGVINVKMNFNINDEFDIEDLEEEMAKTANINAAINQFKQFAVNHNQDWNGIKFVATHLLSAYQSQDKNPKVFALSRFAEVEEFILDKVRRDGRFLRIKTFADAVAVPMSNIILKIYEHSAANLRASDIWFEKRKELDEWHEKFLKRSQERLDNLGNRLSEELESAIYNFVENHYEDQQAGENWQRRFQSLKFNEKYQEFLKGEAAECGRKLKELSDELTQELKFAFKDNVRTNIRLDETTPWGEYFAGGIGALGGLAAGAGAAGFLASRAIGAVFPPLGIALGVISVLGYIFSDSAEEKKRKNQQKLFDAINEPSYKILGEMHSQVVDILNKEILQKGIGEFYYSLASYQFMFARLGDSQSKMAAALFNEFSNLNFKLLGEAVDYKNAGTADEISDIPRVPGEKMIVFAPRSNLNTEELSDLLGEKISVVKPHEDFLQTLKKILDCDFDIDSYPLDFDEENKNAECAYAVFPKQKVKALNFKLAQQTAGVPIIAEIIQPKRITQPAQSQQINQSTSRTKTDWQEVESWLKEFLPKVQTKLNEKGIVNYAAKLFSHVNGKIMRLVYRIYYKEKGKWVAETVACEINKSNVPAWAKAGLTAEEIDVTARYEEKLRLAKRLELII